MREKRTVTLCERTPTSQQAGRGPELWAFGYRALAKLFGMTEGAVRQAVHQGRLDPSDLEAVCQSWMRHHESEARAFIYARDAELSHPTYTLEEARMIEAMRAKVQADIASKKLDPEEEVELLKERCKVAPVVGGPTPADLESEPELDLANDPEVRGIINARCAAGNRTTATCSICGMDIDAHREADQRACLRSATEKLNTIAKGNPDPDVPF